MPTKSTRMPYDQQCMRAIARAARGDVCASWFNRPDSPQTLDQFNQQFRNAPAHLAIARYWGNRSGPPSLVDVQPEVPPVWWHGRTSGRPHVFPRPAPWRCSGGSSQIPVISCCTGCRGDRGTSRRCWPPSRGPTGTLPTSNHGPHSWHCCCSAGRGCSGSKRCRHRWTRLTRLICGITRWRTGPGWPGVSCVRSGCGLGSAACCGTLRTTACRRRKWGFSGESGSPVLAYQAVLRTNAHSELAAQGLLNLAFIPAINNRGTRRYRATQSQTRVCAPRQAASAMRTTPS